MYISVFMRKSACNRFPHSTPFAACTSLNEGTQEKCQTCGGDRLFRTLPTSIAPSGSSASVSFPWHCPFCTYENGPAAVCGMCSKPRPTGLGECVRVPLFLFCCCFLYYFSVFASKTVLSHYKTLVCPCKVLSIMMCLCNFAVVCC